MTGLIIRAVEEYLRRRRGPGGSPESGRGHLFSRSLVFPVWIWYNKIPSMCDCTDQNIQKGEALLNRKLAQLFQPRVQLYFVCLVVFALVSALYSLPLAGAELAVVVCLGLYNRESARPAAQGDQQVSGQHDRARWTPPPRTPW